MLIKPKSKLHITTALSDVFPTSRTHHEVKRARAGGKIWESEVQRANRLMPVKCPEPAGENAMGSSTAGRSPRNGEVNTVGLYSIFLKSTKPKLFTVGYTFEG